VDVMVKRLLMKNTGDIKKSFAHVVRKAFIVC